MSTNAPRYKEYGVYDAYDGTIVSRHASRQAAKSAKDGAAEPHRLRVRGVPPKAKR